MTPIFVPGFKCRAGAETGVTPRGEVTEVRTQSGLRSNRAEVVVDTLKGLGLKWPEVKEKERAKFAEMRTLLEGEE